MINEYFTKVKSLCREISELDPDSKLSDQRMKRIIIHGIRPEYRGFIAAIQDQPTQPSLIQLENLLADKEALAKQMVGVSVKNKEEKIGPDWLVRSRTGLVSDPGLLVELLSSKIAFKPD